MISEEHSIVSIRVILIIICRFFMRTLLINLTKALGIKYRSDWFWKNGISKIERVNKVIIMWILSVGGQRKFRTWTS